MKHRENDLIILLTGTITPNSFSNLSIKDPEIRRQHYRDAINFYVKKTKFKIVFVENSGDQLENFPLAPDRIEYLTFKSAPIQPDRGIGYKEMEIIDYAFEKSNLIKEVKMIVKITGRLKVLNINWLSSRFIKLSTNRSNLIYAYSFKPKNMDSRCFFFTKDFWPYLKSVGRDLNLRYNFELSLWDATCKYQRLEGKSYIPLSTPLRIQGTSGSFGVQYKHGLVFHYARILRNFTSKIFGTTWMVK